jgi:4-amino-4-deoxy-L-arabinose transferase-like glycosyltransferase
MLNNFKKNSLIFVIIFLYILISFVKLEHPGVNNDQLMFVNAATLNPDNMFVWKSFQNIPVLIFPYTGALKSYLYMPIFYSFGVNIYSVRIPQIMLLALAWFLLYIGLKRLFNQKVALLATLLLSLDPSVIVYSRVDIGPTVIEFFLKAVSIYLLTLYLSGKKIIYFLAIFPIFAIGIFNKINFIWFVNAFLISFVIIYGREFYQKWKSHNNILPILLVIGPYLLLFRFFLKLSREVTASYQGLSNEVSLSNLPNTVPIFISNLTDLINGNLLYFRIYGTKITDFGEIFSGFVLVLILIGGWFIFKSKSSFKKSYYFFVLLIILTFLQIILTKKALQAWHTMAIYPFLTIILAAGIFYIWEFTKSAKTKILISFLAVATLLYQLFINFSYINKYSSPTESVAWTSSIYPVIDFAKERPEKFICLDVDICNQLLSLTQQTNKYREPFSFLDPQLYPHQFIKQLDNFKQPDQFLYISHGPQTSHFPSFRESFFKYLQDNQIRFEKIKEFKDGDKITFEIYRISY